MAVPKQVWANHRPKVPPCWPYPCTVLVTSAFTLARKAGTPRLLCVNNNCVLEICSLKWNVAINRPLFIRTRLRGVSRSERHWNPKTWLRCILPRVQPPGDLMASRNGSSRRSPGRRTRARSRGSREPGCGFCRRGGRPLRPGSASNRGTDRNRALRSGSRGGKEREQGVCDNKK